MMTTREHFDENIFYSEHARRYYTVTLRIFANKIVLCYLRCTDRANGPKRHASQFRTLCDFKKNSLNLLVY